MEVVEATKDLPEILATTGRIHMTRKQIAQLIGARRAGGRVGGWVDGWVGGAGGAKERGREGASLAGAAGAVEPPGQGSGGARWACLAATGCPRAFARRPGHQTNPALHADHAPAPAA